MTHVFFLVFEATVSAGATPTPRREGDCDEVADNDAGFDIDIGEDVGVFVFVVVFAVGGGGVIRVVPVAVFGCMVKGFEVRTWEIGDVTPGDGAAPLSKHF